MADSVRQTVTIAASPEEVWAVLMDPRSLEDWVSAHRKLDELPELPLGSGDRFRQKLGVGPASFWVEWEVIEARQPQLARWRGEGPGGSTAEVLYRLGEDGPGSTRFEYENDFDPPGGAIGRAAARVVNATAGEREARKSMARLKELVEAA
ncbi:MAG TPA: SRPBCC family protein [Solirubrobacterales bacterium]|nr:SRPBCC family protein [Solirubrobacterales bacterium]